MLHAPPARAAWPGAQHQGVLDRLAQHAELELEVAPLDGGQQLGHWVRAKERQGRGQIEHAEPDSRGRSACSYRLLCRGISRRPPASPVPGVSVMAPPAGRHLRKPVSSRKQILPPARPTGCLQKGPNSEETLFRPRFSGSGKPPPAVPRKPASTSAWRIGMASVWNGTTPRLRAIAIISESPAPMPWMRK